MLKHLNESATPPRRVVLLGARGFIGVRLAAELGRLGVATLALGSADIDLTAADGQARLEALLRPDDSVIMLSALTPDKGKGSDTLLRNLAMARTVCEALAKVGCAHAVYVSSDAVYSADQSLVSEETPPSPGDLYGVMHLARELMFKAVPKLPLTIVRPTLVYGLADTHNSYGPNRFRRNAEKDGRINLFGNGDETRDHVFVDDVARLLAQILLMRTVGLLNIATGHSHTFRATAELVAATFDTKVDVVPSASVNAVTHRHYDITALHAAFPEMRYLPLEEGVRRVRREATGQA